MPKKTQTEKNMMDIHFLPPSIMLLLLDILTPILLMWRIG